MSSATQRCGLRVRRHTAAQDLCNCPASAGSSRPPRQTAVVRAAGVRQPHRPAGGRAPPPARRRPPRRLQVDAETQTMKSLTVRRCSRPSARTGARDRRNKSSYRRVQRVQAAIDEPGRLLNRLNGLRGGGVGLQKYQGRSGQQSARKQWAARRTFDAAAGRLAPPCHPGATQWHRRAHKLPLQRGVKAREGGARRSLGSASMCARGDPAMRAPGDAATAARSGLHSRAAASRRCLRPP